MNMNMLLKKSLRRGWPAGLIGLFVGLNLVLAIAAISIPIPTKATDTCGGSYPCFTPRACEAAHGTFIACPTACPGAGVQRGYCYARSEPIPLTVSIGGLNRTIDLGEYIQAVYNYGVAIAGIFAAVMMMIGGIQWLTAGTSDRVSAARKRILDAAIGLALTVFAWFILNTINPALVILQMPRIPMVKQERLVRCDLFRLERSCGVEFGVKANEDASDTATERERFTITETNDPDILTTCVGKNCAGVNDCTAGGCTCQRTGASASATPDTGTVAAGGTSSEWECRPCIAADQECQGLGPSDGCCGGYCGAIDDSVDQVIARTGAGTPVETTSNFIGSGLPGSCSSGMHGLKCGSAQECVGGYCVDASDYFQAFTGVRNVAGGVRDIFAGAYRLDWTEIVQGLAQLQLAPNATVAGIWAGGICSNGSVGALCNNNEDCAGGNHCIEQAGIHVCSPSIVGSACSDTEAWGGGTDTSRTPCPEGSVCDLETNRCVRAASSARNSCGRVRRAESFRKMSQD